VVGRLHLNEWTGREGERRLKLQVSTPTKPEVSPGAPGVADAVQLFGSPKRVGYPDGGVASDGDGSTDKHGGRRLRAQGQLNPAGSDWACRPAELRQSLTTWRATVRKTGAMRVYQEHAYTTCVDVGVAPLAASTLPRSR
jgi:hypothetical protein